MADSIKEFSIDWVLSGLLLFCLLTIAITFMYYNNSDGFGSSGALLENASNSIQSELIELPTDTNNLLNVSSKTDPEASFLGSRDSVATSYGITSTSKRFFTQSKNLISWIFTGTTGQILLSVFGGLFSLVALYYILKFIRNQI